MRGEPLSTEVHVPGWLVILALLIFVVMILWLAFTSPPDHSEDDEHLPVREEDFDE